HIADYFITNLTRHNHVFHGAYDALDYLKTKYRLHIITNGPEKVQEQKLKNSKLDHYFKTITNSEKSGVKKPHPNIFKHALQLAETSPEQSVMIGDSLSADISGALGVGMNVIWFNEFRKTTDLKVTEIHQLNEIINKLEDEKDIIYGISKHFCFKCASTKSDKHENCTGKKCL